ncbi:hypothetical protein AC579_6277 [Pseudocercospora musae]|uniref:SET domain-containing protein n=1 Tax=Pseudocercospora musae TaxID=113226 RepID=A0A139IPN5_9PEZI|nr:hypothetical protein AC579_6277 [Pseudocercospora musae]
MAGPFTLYTPERPRGYLHTDAPERIEEFRFSRKPWQGKRVPRKWPAKPINAKKWILPKSVGDVLHNEHTDACWQCDQVQANDCGDECIQQWRDDNFKYEAEIRPARFGMGAFNGKEKLPKGKCIGEYLGDLIPINDAPDSMYRMEVEGIFCVDASVAGNWTRYINSSCTPNLHCTRVCIGKRFGLFFHTLRDILPGEELTFAYGYDFFAGKAMKCGCDWKPELHSPKGAPKDKTSKQQNEANTGETSDVSTEGGASPPFKGTIGKTSSASGNGDKSHKKIQSGLVQKSPVLVETSERQHNHLNKSRPRTIRPLSPRLPLHQAKLRLPRAPLLRHVRSSKGTISSKSTASSRSSSVDSSSPIGHNTRPCRSSRRPPPR